MEELTQTAPSRTNRPFLGALVGGRAAVWMEERAAAGVRMGGGDRVSRSFSRRWLHFSFSPPSPLLRRKSRVASDTDSEVALLEEEGGREEEEE